MSSEDIERRQQFRKMYVKHLETIQMMPADQVNSYLEQRENNAAAIIQASWKGYKCRKMLSDAKYGIKENKAAIIIQREIRKWLERTNKTNKMKEYEYFHILNQKEVNWPCSEAEKWKEKVSNVKPQSQEELKKQFHKAREMLELFHVKRSTRIERIHNIDTLLTKLDADTLLFTNLPSLEEVTEEEANLFHVFSSTVASQAKHAHDKEMKKVIYPWRRDLTIINRNEWLDLFPEFLS